MILPEALYDLIWGDVAAKIQDLKYERVIMALPELLEGEFFNQYIKSGRHICSRRFLAFCLSCFNLQ